MTEHIQPEHIQQLLFFYRLEYSSALAVSALASLCFWGVTVYSICRVCNCKCRADYPDFWRCTGKVFALFGTCTTVATVIMTHLTLVVWLTPMSYLGTQQ